MGEITSANGRWRKGGTPLTLEEWRALDVEPPKPPAAGTRLLERIVVSPDEEAWRRQAACRGKPTHWWFPDNNEWRSANALLARQICSTCPVIEPCRETARTRNERGIWGETALQVRKVQPRTTRKPEPVQRRKRAPKPRTGRPLSPVSQALVDAMAGGHWVDVDELVDRVRHVVTDDQARRRQAGVLKGKGRDVAPEDIGAAGIRAGQREVVRSSLCTLQRKGYVEGVRGAWRIKASEQAICV